MMINQIIRRLAMLAALAIPYALAQNSDLGLLLGVTLPSSEVSTARVRSSAGGSAQINYAYQLLGSPAGELYLEFPFVISAENRAEVSRVAVVASSGATLLFTPGVRYRLPLHNRLSLYGALGAGVGAFGGSVVAVGPGAAGRTASPVLDFGGGIDIRFTRLLSLRGEIRDFIGLSGLGGNIGRHHVIGQGGLAFHF